MRELELPGMKFQRSGRQQKRPVRELAVRGTGRESVRIGREVE